MPAPPPESHEETNPSRPAYLAENLAAILDDTKKCTNLEGGKALWRPTTVEKVEGMWLRPPRFQTQDVVAVVTPIGVPRNYVYDTRLAVMSAWSKVRTSAERFHVSRAYLNKLSVCSLQKPSFVACSPSRTAERPSQSL
jgi:hypothetical protein